MTAHTTKHSRTKIVATIGPASWDVEILKDMIRNGMNVARINASFADCKELERVSKQIRELSSNVAIMLGTKGPKIRVTGFDDDIILENGMSIILQAEKAHKNGHIHAQTDIPIISVTYPTLAQDLTRNTEILLDDGNITLQVADIKNDILECRVLAGGVLQRRKTVSIPGVHLNFPELSEKDKGDIEFAVKHDFDYISASFVRNIKDVKAIRECMGDTQTKLIAKIEEFQGVQNFDAILEQVDGIMVARGDLGVQLPLERVPILQKEFVEKCRIASKPVIVATQMLESMRENSRPTRAEVSDVANAVVDGADALMLSAETSTGKHPAEAVKTMKKIVAETENALDPRSFQYKTPTSTETDHLAYYISKLVNDLQLKCVIVISRSGKSVASLARHRLSVPIWSLSTNPKIIAQHNLVYGVTANHIPDLPTDRDELVDVVINKIYSTGQLKQSDKVAILSGSSIKNRSINSILEIINVGDALV